MRQRSACSKDRVAFCEPQEVASLRQALQMTQRSFEQAVVEAAADREAARCIEDHCSEEDVKLSDQLDALTRENQRLQVTSRNRWDAARRMQASLRERAAEAQRQAQELHQVQKRLELENHRLRQGASAMRARLLVWRQSSRRNNSLCSLPSGGLAPLEAHGCRRSSASLGMGQAVNADELFDPLKESWESAKAVTKGVSPRSPDLECDSSSSTAGVGSTCLPYSADSEEDIGASFSSTEVLSSLATAEAP